MTDVGLQAEGESGGTQTSRAGDEQKDSLHGLKERASVLDSKLSARPVKSITANSKLSDNLASVLGESECPLQRFCTTH